MNRYFNEFELERITFDKCFFTVYSPSYAMTDHPFDAEVRDLYHTYVKRGAVKRGKFSEVLHIEVSDYAFFEMKLNTSRSMFCHVNVIRYLQELRGIRPAPITVIQDYNFMPIDSDIQLKDYIDALYRFIELCKTKYRQLVKQFWDITLDDVTVLITQLEINYEVYPASVEDIAARLRCDGVTFKKYNTQTGTIYMDAFEGGVDIRLPNGMSTRIDPDIDKVEVTQRVGQHDTSFCHGVNSGYSDRKVLIKFYQKSFGLVRTEFTFFKEDIKSILDMKLSLEWIENDARVVEDFVFSQLRRRHLESYVKRFDTSLEDIVQNISDLSGVPVYTINSLKDVDVFESSRKTDSLRRKLLKKGIIVGGEDDTGVKRRRIYPVSAWFRNLFKDYKPKDPKSLFLLENLKLDLDPAVYRRLDGKSSKG